MRWLMPWVAALPLLLAPLPAQKTLTVRWTFQPGFDVAEEKVIDLDGDGRDELLLLGVRGEVRLFSPATGKLRGDLDLPEPTRSLVSLAALDGGRQVSLVVLSSRGVDAYALKDGVFSGPGQRLLRRGRLTMRVGQPRISNIAQDVNGDGRPDLVVPGHTSYTLYLNRPVSDTDPGPKFVRTSRLDLRVSASAATRATRLSDVLSSSFRVPDLRTEDVNGDGRKDIIAEVTGHRLFHMQRADGHFPERPDVDLDLGMFRDTTPKAGIQLGQTLSLDEAIYHSRDLNADQIPDYVIAHRRKIWVFHGSKAGPQFTKPSSILKLAEDVTFLWLMQLNQDSYPDLLVFKVGIPTLGTLFRGLLFEWDVTMKSLGYANVEGRSFSKTPSWKSDTTLRLPSILGVMSDPESIVERFKEVGRKFRHSVEADLDGDGKIDVLMQTEDHKILQFWLIESAAERGPDAEERQLRALLFEDENRLWTVERVLSALGSYAKKRNLRLTRGREPAGAVELRNPDHYRLDFAAAADLDGDGRQEILLHYLSLTSPSRSTFDILHLPQ